MYPARKCIYPPTEHLKSEWKSSHFNDRSHSTQVESLTCYQISLQRHFKAFEFEGLMPQVRVSYLDQYSLISKPDCRYPFGHSTSNLYY